MRELLFFPENLTSPLQWASFGQDGKLTLQDAVLPSAWQGVDRLAKKGITLILAGEQVASYRFAMPKVSGNGREQAIAFALEGICSQSLDDIYVIAGDYLDGKQSALVIQRSYLDGVLGFAKTHDLKITSIRIDYMLLAQPEPQAWTVTQVNDTVLWRTDCGTGGRVDAPLWPFILEQMLMEGLAPKKLVWLSTKKNTKLPALPNKVHDAIGQTTEQVISWIDKQVLDAPAPYPLNLGPNRFRSLFNRRKQAMRQAIKIGVLAGILAILCQLSFTVFVHVRYRHVNKVVQQWLQSSGFAGLPLPEVKARLEAAINASEKMQANNGFLLTLSAISHILAKAQMNDIVAIDYTSKQGVRLQVQPKVAAAIEAQLKQGLQGYTVSMLALPSAKKLIPTVATAMPLSTIQIKRMSA